MRIQEMCLSGMRALGRFGHLGRPANRIKLGPTNPADRIPKDDEITLSQRQDIPGKHRDFKNM